MQAFPFDYGHKCSVSIIVLVIADITKQCGKLIELLTIVVRHVFGKVRSNYVWRLVIDARKVSRKSWDSVVAQD